MPEKKNNQGPGGKRNINAILFTVLWALVIVVFLNYMTSIARSANTEEITYGQFRQMVMDGEVEAVELSATRYIIYPKTKDAPPEGSAQPTRAPQTADTEADPLEELQSQLQMNLPPLEELNGSPQSGRKTYYCAPLTQANVRDDGLIELLETNGVVQYGTPYEEPLSPIVSLLISYALVPGPQHGGENGRRSGRSRQGQRKGLRGALHGDHLPGRGGSGRGQGVPGGDH